MAFGLAQLLGENGIVSTNRYSCTEATGDPSKSKPPEAFDLAFRAESESGCNVSALSCVPNANICDLHNICTHFGKNIKHWFQETFVEPDVVIIVADGVGLTLEGARRKSQPIHSQQRAQASCHCDP